MDFDYRLYAQLGAHGEPYNSVSTQRRNTKIDTFSRIGLSIDYHFTTIVEMSSDVKVQVQLSDYPANPRMLRPPVQLNERNMMNILKLLVCPEIKHAVVLMKKIVPLTADRRSHLWPKVDNL